MTNKRGTNNVNEELPDEHEVIQHSLRGNPDKTQQDRVPAKQNTGVRKPDGSRLDKANPSSDSEAKRHKRR